MRAVWFAAVAGTGAGTAGIASTNTNCATTTRRRHSVATHPHSVNNSQSVHVTTTSTTTTTTTTITITTAATVTTTTTTATISHQRTLSLPLAAVFINQMQSSKRSVLRCMYFCFVIQYVSKRYIPCFSFSVSASLFPVFLLFSPSHFLSFSSIPLIQPPFAGVRVRK